MELKVSDLEAIQKFANTIINNPNYKDKEKPPEKMFYEIWNSEGKKIGASRKSVKIEDIQKELLALGEGKYFLQDAEDKLEVKVYNENNNKKEPEKKVSKDSSKTLNESERNMDEKRTMVDVMKDNGRIAGGKIMHGAKVKIANKALEAVLLKLWLKTGKNELIGQMLNDELGRAILKASLGFVAQGVANEKQFAGSDYVLEVSGLVLEGAGSDAAGPLIDMITPLISEFVSAGKEIADLDISKLGDNSKEEDFDAEAVAKELQEFNKKNKEKKTAEA